MIVAARIEATLGKDEILEIYLNSVYLGRSSWGVEMAARSYFGKPAKQLTVTEGALLAALTKGPRYLSPDRQPARAQERLAYVLDRMREAGMLGAGDEESGRGLPALPAMMKLERPRRDIGFHFIDQVAREAKSVAGLDALTARSYTVRSTIDPHLQRAVEEALQEGLSRYERGAGRVQFLGAEANLAAAVQKIEAGGKRTDKRPYWQQALAEARLPLYDVHWTPAAVVERPGAKRGDAWRVGLADGRILPLSVDNAAAQRRLTLYDVVLVSVTEGKGKAAARAALRVRPGAAARFGHQAAELSGGAGQGPAAQYSDQRQRHHVPADQARPRQGPGLLVAEELRRWRRRHPDVAPGPGEFAQSRHRAPAPGRHRGQAGSEPRPPVPARIGSADLS
jgi:penicillin-binding protein 1A